MFDLSPAAELPYDATLAYDGILLEFSCHQDEPPLADVTPPEAAAPPLFCSSQQAVLFDRAHELSFTIWSLSQTAAVEATPIYENVVEGGSGCSPFERAKVLVHVQER